MSLELQGRWCSQKKVKGNQKGQQSSKGHHERNEEHVTGHDLFVSFLKSNVNDESVKKVILICYENPPEFYLNEEVISLNKKLQIHNVFVNPCGWNDSPPLKPNPLQLEEFVKDSTESVVFIDSVSFLCNCYGFPQVYKVLNDIKNCCNKLICLVHGDLFSNVKLEELYFLSSVLVKLIKFTEKKNSSEKICEVTYKKPGGKVVKQTEMFVVSKDFDISSSIVNENKVSHLKISKDMESLTTFDLGTEMKEEERKAKENLVLPYLRKKEETKEGQILYEPDIDDWEDDPDDDLDI